MTDEAEQFLLLSMAVFHHLLGAMIISYVYLVLHGEPLNAAPAFTRLGVAVCGSDLRYLETNLGAVTALDRGKNRRAANVDKRAA